MRSGAVLNLLMARVLYVDSVRTKNSDEIYLAYSGVMVIGVRLRQCSEQQACDHEEARAGSLV